MTTNEPSVLDDIAQDALTSVADVADDYPEGTPELVPYLQLRPRSRRAAFKRKYAEFARIEDQVKDMNRRLKEVGDDVEVTPEVTSLRMRLWADADDMYQLMDETLELAASDEVAYRAWSDNMDDDNQLSTVFSLYLKLSQPGEALSSAT